MSAYTDDDIRAAVQYAAKENAVCCGDVPADEACIRCQDRLFNASMLTDLLTRRAEARARDGRTCGNCENRYDDNHCMIWIGRIPEVVTGCTAWKAKS